MAFLGTDFVVPYVMKFERNKCLSYKMTLVQRTQNENHRRERLIVIVLDTEDILVSALY